YGIQIKQYHRLLFQRPLAPIGKQGLKTPHYPRDRTLGKWHATQKRRKRPSNPPPVRSAEVTPQQSTVHRSGAPLIALTQHTLPFLALLSSRAQPGSRQLDDRRPQPGADPSLPTAVSIPPRRSLLRWYGPAANTSASSASANFNITSRTLPRNASLNR